MKKVALGLVLAVCLVTAACSVDQVLTDINLLIQTAGSIGTAIGAVAPADAAIVAGLTAVASKGLTAIQAAYDTYKQTQAQTDLQKLDAAIAAVKTNLPAELAAAHVYSPAAQAKCAAWVNLTVTTLDAISELLPELQTAQTANAKAYSRAEGCGQAGISRRRPFSPAGTRKSVRARRSVQSSSERAANSGPSVDRIRMAYALVALSSLLFGIAIGAVYRAHVQADALARAGKLYKELVLRGDAAIAVLSRVKEEIAQIDGGGRKRVVLASDLSGIRKMAGVPEAIKVEEQNGIKIVGG